MYVKMFYTKKLEKDMWIIDDELESKVNDFLKSESLVFYNITANIDYVMIIYDLIDAKETYEIHNESLLLKK